MAVDSSPHTARSRWIRIGLACGFTLVAGLGLVAELVHAVSHSEPIEATVGMLSLSYEQNLPTWYASILLFLCSLSLAAIAIDSRDRHRPHWWVLSAGFAMMSIDEVAELHEQLGGLFGGSGVLYFDWVIPAGIAVAIIGLAFVPFLRRLPPATRRRFLVAGAVYLGGALAMELPLGAWAEQSGDDNATYALLDFIEESLELCGASLFLLALWRHRTEPGGVT